MKSLIRSLRVQVANNDLSSNNIKDAVVQLRTLGYSSYDEDKFPTLKVGHIYGLHSSRYEDLEKRNSPMNLAEAMLWKLGKWRVYKSFVKNYDDSDLIVTSEGGVVMSAFAKHLQDPENPIYDQHVVRSLWAIAPLDKAELIACESLLIDGNGNWKESGSGKSAVSCYKLFVKHASAICKSNSISLREFDLLMMPLGQALKTVTRKRNKVKSDLEEFKVICGL